MELNDGALNKTTDIIHSKIWYLSGKKIRDITDINVVISVSDGVHMRGYILITNMVTNNIKNVIKDNIHRKWWKECY